MSRSDEDRLLDVIAAIEAIGRHVERGSLQDGLIFDAVRARLMEIGEAVKDLDPQVLAGQPSIPWRRIAAMRDQLAHRYFDTSHSIVASTVADDLAELRTAVDHLLGVVRRRRLEHPVQPGGQLEAAPRARGMPETDVARAQRWCRDRVPGHLRDQVRIEVDVEARHLTIVECRPPWDGVGDWTRLAIARLRYTKASGLWSLYWRDRNERFHVYDGLAASENVQVLLDEIEQDPTAIFWG